jgi:hypothetical protein
MYNSLVCGQRTAMSALKTLASHLADQLKDIFVQAYQEQVIGPIICIDNLDIEERVHTHAIGNQTWTFHGTWGYVYLPSPELIGSLNWDKINVHFFKEALRKVPLMPVEPCMLMPTQAADEHYKHVWLSQIASV